MQFSQHIWVLLLTHVHASLPQEKERLAQMVEELNDIVFSKTFKAPSAWADRERKYKMEARDWDIEVGVLRMQSEKLPDSCSYCPMVVAQRAMAMALALHKEFDGPNLKSNSFPACQGPATVCSA